MPEGYQRLSAGDPAPVAGKPGTRRALSQALGIDAFNLNVATLEPGDRLSENHYHYHENQAELCYVTAGRCRVEVHDGGFPLTADEVVTFDPGDQGVHVVHNPYGEACQVIALGWPPEGRYPVKQVRTLDVLLTERYGGDPPTV